MTIEQQAEVKEDRRTIEKRIERRLEEVRRLNARSRAILDEWRAKGILPPEEPRRPV